MGHLAANSPIEWVGSVDAEYDSDPFFLGDPVQLFLRGKFFSEDTPIMIGFNKDEGLGITTEFLQAPSTFERFKGEWDQCKTRHLFSIQNSGKANKLAEEVNEFYFGSKNPNLEYDKHLQNLTNIFSDAHLNAVNHAAVR